MPQILQLPPGNRRGPNCGITALAVVSGSHYQDVWEMVKECKPSNWKGSVWDADVTRTLRRLGVRYRSRLFEQTITVREFAERYAKPGVFYLIDLADHIAVLANGVILDQRGYFSLKQKGHWKLHRVYAIRE